MKILNYKKYRRLIQLTNIVNSDDSELSIFDIEDAQMELLTILGALPDLELQELGYNDDIVRRARLFNGEVR